LTFNVQGTKFLGNYRSVISSRTKIQLPAQLHTKPGLYSVLLAIFYSHQSTVPMVVRLLRISVFVQKPK